jgi:hypothetical protein
MFVRLCYRGSDGYCLDLFCIYIYFFKVKIIYDSIRVGVYKSLTVYAEEIYCTLCTMQYLFIPPQELLVFNVAGVDIISEADHDKIKKYTYAMAYFNFMFTQRFLRRVRPFGMWFCASLLRLLFDPQYVGRILVILSSILWSGGICSCVTSKNSYLSTIEERNLGTAWDLRI